MSKTVEGFDMNDVIQDDGEYIFNEPFMVPRCSPILDQCDGNDDVQAVLEDEGIYPQGGMYRAEEDSFRFRAHDRSTMIGFLRNLNEFLAEHTPVGVEFETPDDLSNDDRVDEILDERNWPQRVTVYLRKESAREISEAVLGEDWQDNDDLKEWGCELENLFYEVEVELVLHRDGSVEVENADFPDSVNLPQEVSSRLN